MLFDSLPGFVEMWVQWGPVRTTQSRTGFDAQPSFASGNRALHRSIATLSSPFSRWNESVCADSRSGQWIVILHGVHRPGVTEKARPRLFGSIPDTPFLMSVKVSLACFNFQSYCWFLQKKKKKGVKTHRSGYPTDPTSDLSFFFFFYCHISPKRVKYSWQDVAMKITGLGLPLIKIHLEFGMYRRLFIFQN